MLTTRIKIAISAFFFMTIIFGFVSCGRDISLENKLWVLAAYGEPGDLKFILKDKDITIIFDSNGRKVSGSDGCNAYAGTYELKRNKISFLEPFVVTQRACNGLAEFWSILGTNESYKIENGKLIITNNKGMLIFKLK